MNLYSGDAPLSPLTVDPLTSGGSPTLLAHSKPFPEPSLRAYSHSSHNNNRTGLEPNQCLLYSEENNSPTALNTDKSMEDKPPLMKRIAMSLNPKTMPDDEDSPLVQRNPVTGRDSRSSTHPLIDLDVIKQLNLDNRFVSPFQFFTLAAFTNILKPYLLKGRMSSFSVFRETLSKFSELCMLTPFETKRIRLKDFMLIKSSAKILF